MKIYFYHNNENIRFIEILFFFIFWYFCILLIFLWDLDNTLLRAFVFFFVVTFFSFKKPNTSK